MLFSCTGHCKRSFSDVAEGPDSDTADVKSELQTSLCHSKTRLIINSEPRRITRSPRSPIPPGQFHMLILLGHRRRGSCSLIPLPQLLIIRLCADLSDFLTRRKRNAWNSLSSGRLYYWQEFVETTVTRNHTKPFLKARMYVLIVLNVV